MTFSRHYPPLLSRAARRCVALAGSGHKPQGCPGATAPRTPYGDRNSSSLRSRVSRGRTGRGWRQSVADVERKMQRFFGWLSEKDHRRYAAVRKQRAPASRQGEAEASHVHLQHPVPQTVHNELERARVGHVRRRWRPGTGYWLHTSLAPSSMPCGRVMLRSARTVPSATAPG